MRSIAPALLFSFVLVSCARNLKEDITLNIDDDSVHAAFSAPVNGSYVDDDDSDRVYDEIMNDLKQAFRDKGNDVNLQSQNADYTLRFLEWRFSEHMTTESVTDPCDTANTLQYTVSAIHGYIKCEVVNNFTGQDEFIEAESDSDEDVKNSPTIWQVLIGHDSCYTPRVSNAHPDAVKRRLVRRIHRQAMQVIKAWQ